MNKKALLKTATDAAIAALAGTAYYIFIKVTGLSIPCYIHLTTGLLCPSCGITRMFLFMAQFKFKEAMRCNEFLFFGWPVIVLLVLYVMYKYHAREKLHKFSYVLMFVMIGISIVFCIIRNINLFR